MVQKRFNFPPDSVELYAEKVSDRGLCAVAQAESLRYKLLGGLAVRRCGSSPGRCLDRRTQVAAASQRLGSATSGAAASGHFGGGRGAGSCQTEGYVWGPQRPWGRVVWLRGRIWRAGACSSLNMGLGNAGWQLLSIGGLGSGSGALSGVSNGHGTSYGRYK